MSSHPGLASEPDGGPPAARDGGIRVVLADDHALVRRGLRDVLDAEVDVELVGEAVDVGSATRQVKATAPDVLVLDLSRPGGSSIETIGALRERSPHTQIVVMTTSESPVFARRALAAGALGYISKELADVELPRAVRAVADGQQYVSPSLASRLAALNGNLTDNRLTPRELEVLRLIALGHTSVETARKLHLSPRTVETHRAHLHRKLALATRAQLVGYALRRGLLGN